MNYKGVKAVPTVFPVPEGVKGVLLTNGRPEFFQLLGFVYRDEELEGFFLPTYLDLNGLDVVFIVDRYLRVWGGRDCLEGMELNEFVEWASAREEWA